MGGTKNLAYAQRKGQAEALDPFQGTCEGDGFKAGNLF